MTVVFFLIVNIATVAGVSDRVIDDHGIPSLHH